MPVRTDRTNRPPSRVTNVVTLALLFLFLCLVIWFLYHGYQAHHQASSNVSTPTPSQAGRPPMFPPQQQQPNVPVPSNCPVCKPCKPCTPCKPCEPPPPCPQCLPCPSTSMPAVPPAVPPTAPTTPTPIPTPIPPSNCPTSSRPIWPTVPSDITPGSLGGTLLTIECSENSNTKPISPYDVPDCFSPSDQRISCRSKVQEYQPRTNNHSNMQLPYYVDKFSPRPLLPLSMQPQEGMQTASDSGLSQGESQTRLILHYYFLNQCPACEIFRNEVWEPLKRNMDQNGIVFHEINGDTYDGRVQIQKHNIQSFPTLAWSQTGINQPHTILHAGLRDREQIVSKVQLLLQ